MNKETNKRGRRFSRIRLGGLIAGIAVCAMTLSVHAVPSDSYTNLNSGATYTFDGDIATGMYRGGITFDGAGALDGIGNLTVTNVSQNTIYGIKGNSITNAWDGTLRVESDQSLLGTSDQLSVIGFDGNIVGALDGDLVVIAQASSDVLDTSATAYGVDGSIYGDVNGNMLVMARVGTNSNGNVNGAADAYGVHDGNIEGNLNGDITVAALAQDGAMFGDATAYGVDGSVNGDLRGELVATAQGGGFSDRSDARAYGVNGDVDGDLSGSITATATAGESSSYGFATAQGVVGGNITGDLTGTVTATAIGGMNSVDADALAYGVRGSIDGTISGTIEATAIAGYREIVPGFFEPAMASAYGVYIDNNSSLLTVDGGTIHATIGALDGLEPELGSVAYAIYVDDAGSGTNSLVDQVVTLSNADLIGDIELGAGANELIILGDTHMDGNIAATQGLLDFRIDEGILTFARSTSVSDLGQTGLIVSERGGLGFELTAGEQNTLLLDGKIVVEEGATLLIASAPGNNGAELLGNEYVLIDAPDMEGSFVANEKSLLLVDINTNVANQVSVTPTGLKYQDSQAAANQSLMVANSVHATMNHLSAQAAHRRSFAQNVPNNQQPDLEAPVGPSGPSENKEWMLFLRQVNDLGSIDSDGSVAGNDWSSHGLLLGAEKLISENMIMGASVGGTWTSLDGNDRSSDGSSEMVNAALYLSQFSEKRYTELGLIYAEAWNEGSRTDSMDDVYNSKNDSRMMGAWLEHGYIFPANETIQLEPYGRLAYVHGQHDGYTESGIAGSPMTVKGHQTDNLISTLGVRGTTSWTLQNESQIKLGLAAGWRHEWLDDIISVNSSVIGINQKSRSVKADRDALALGLDAKWLLSDAWSFSLAYEPTISGNWFNHAINGSIRFHF